MQTIRLARKPSEVDAIRVTEENMNDVAEWCNGDIKMQVNKNGSEPYIKVRVLRPLNEKQTRAFVGDWVLKSKTGFKVYTNRAKENTFEEKVVYYEADALAQLED